MNRSRIVKVSSRRSSCRASADQKYNRNQGGSFSRANNNYQHCFILPLLTECSNITMTQTQRDGFLIKTNTYYRRTWLDKFKVNFMHILIFDITYNIDVPVVLKIGIFIANIIQHSLTIITLLINMQNSRLGRLGKQSLKNRTNFTLIQQINSSQFSNDQPLKNTSTLYLDQNGKQTQFAELKASNLKYRNNIGQKFINSSPSQLGQSNLKDLYALPVVNVTSNSSFEANNKIKSNTKLVKSQYMTQRSALDSIRQENISDIYAQTRTKRYNQKQKNTQKLLSIKRPKGFLKKGQKFQDIDFIGDNLYEVEDIITDIGKIMQHTKRKNIVVASTEPKAPLKSNKWLNSHFGGISKLDEMLMNYRTVPQQMPRMTIKQDYFRQSKYQQNYGQARDTNTPKLQAKSKLNSFKFPSKNINSNQHKLSLVAIKWNQLPMIGTKWQSSIYLKLQSYPQQQQYRKVVLKAYSLNIKSYSIFIQADAGVVQPAKISQNDKNKNNKKLMSEQEYAKAWEDYLQKQQSSKQGQQTLTEQQRQILMQFDIEWYRTIIQFCYHSGLEDLLEKQYDINIYTSVMAQLQRSRNGISAQSIIKNQIKYILEYFKQIYTYTSNETAIGMIRINNDQNMKIEDVYANFDAMLNDNTGNNQNADVEFCIWPLKTDNSQLIVLLQLCGNPKPQHIVINNSQQTITINMKQPNYTLQLIEENRLAKKDTQDQYDQSYEQPDAQEQHEQAQDKSKAKSKGSGGKGNSDDVNRLVLKINQENDWQVYMKVVNSKTQKQEMKINMVQELLFGVIYKIQ